MAQSALVQPRIPQRSPLPAVCERYITDAGLETELVFKDGIDLPLFSAATLLDKESGRERLRRYFHQFVLLAEQYRTGVLLETTTWRLSADWGERLGYDRAGRRRLNAEAVRLLAGLRSESSLAPDRFVICGNLGPRYDGYAVDTVMGAEQARAYHTEQVADLTQSGVDAISALTITTSAEALGIALAAHAEGVPAVISFTVETDGRLPSGESLGDAIVAVDEGAPGAVEYFGINCAHPSHFADAIRAGESWRARIGAIRANASKKSHAELDNSTELDEGDPAELASAYRQLFDLLPALRVVGGCCGTDAAHVQAICRSCLTE